jgi:hypothetical protein
MVTPTPRRKWRRERGEENMGRMGWQGVKLVLVFE